MAEIPIERRPRRSPVAWFIGIIIVLLVLAAIWYFWLYLPGAGASRGEPAVGTQPAPGATAPQTP